MVEVLYGLVDGQQLAVIGAVILLGWVELFGGGKRLSGVLNVLL
jgi:hypothetical protein